MLQALCARRVTRASRRGRESWPLAGTLPLGTLVVRWQVVSGSSGEGDRRLSAGPAQGKWSPGAHCGQPLATAAEGPSPAPPASCLHC